MASSFYDKSDKSVTPLTVARARDLNTINDAVDAAFVLVESSFGNIETLSVSRAEAWAENPEDVELDLGEGNYSALHHSAKASAQRVLAETARVDSQTAQGLSESARDAAQLAETNAETAQGLAETAQGLAETAQGLAETAQGLAETARDKAQDWAEEDEDVEVEVGKYSAKHWAKKSEVFTIGVTPPSDDPYSVSWDGSLIAPTKNVVYDKFESLTKSDVGLSNVDNTSDLNKPISSATQTALNGKANTVHVHDIDDVTGLQTELDGKEPSLSDPAMDGYMLSSSADGTRSWVAVSDEGRKNYIINGNFDIWQRGKSLLSGTGRRFLADRWHVERNLSSYSAERKSFTLGQTDVPHEPRFWHRTTVSSVSGGSSYLRQRIEGVHTLAGQTATLSFYAKSTAPVMEVVLTQWFGTGGTPSDFVNTSFEVVTLGSDWNRYSLTFSIPSIAGKTLGTSNDDALLVTFWLEGGSSSIGNQSGTFDIAQVQLEKGSFATEFERRSYGEELALCQRYYWRGQAIGVGSGFIVAPGNNSLMQGPYIIFPVPMRTTPTMTILIEPTYSNSTTNATPFTVDTYFAMHRIDGITAGNGARAYNGWYEADAEL